MFETVTNSFSSMKWVGYQVFMHEEVAKIVVCTQETGSKFLFFFFFFIYVDNAQLLERKEPKEFNHT